MLSPAVSTSFQCSVQKLLQWKELWDRSGMRGVCGHPGLLVVVLGGEGPNGCPLREVVGGLPRAALISWGGNRRSAGVLHEVASSGNLEADTCFPWQFKLFKPHI